MKKRFGKRTIATGTMALWAAALGLTMMLVIASPNAATAQTSLNRRRKTPTPVAAVSARGAGEIYFKGRGEIAVEAQTSGGIVTRNGSTLTFSPSIQIRFENGENGGGIRIVGAKYTTIRNFRGRAFITSPKSTAWFRLTGTNLSLDGKGIGRANLKGRGIWGVNGQKGEWTKRGVRVVVAG